MIKLLEDADADAEADVAACGEEIELGGAVNSSSGMSGAVTFGA